MICRKYSFPKWTQFSQGNNVPDATASNTHRFLSRHICVSSPYLNRPIWSKKSLSTRWNIKIAWNIPFKYWHISLRETLCSILLLFTQMVFFERFIGFFSFAEWAYLQQTVLFFLESYDLKDVFLSNNLNFDRQMMCYMILLLTQIGFFQEIHVFHHLSWIGLFGVKRA
jgi:hypothetical protein